MLDRVLAKQNKVVLLEQVMSSSYIGSHDVVQYLLWSLKPEDFQYTDGPLTQWIRKKLETYTYIGIYVEHLQRTRKIEELRRFILDYGKRHHEFMAYLSSLREHAESEQLQLICKYFKEHSHVPGHFTIT